MPVTGRGTAEGLSRRVDALAQTDPSPAAQCDLDPVHVVADGQSFLCGEDAEAAGGDAVQDRVHRRSVGHLDDPVTAPATSVDKARPGSPLGVLAQPRGSSLWVDTEPGPHT